MSAGCYEIDVTTVSPIHRVDASVASDLINRTVAGDGVGIGIAGGIDSTGSLEFEIGICAI